jgi:acetoin utilization deacetylase AcuC-like enzyme
MNIAGGTHHAFTNKGEGFCLLNDIAMASQYLLSKKLVNRILVVDLDVHQGNGTAQIFKDDDRVFTFSMHGAYNYPLVKETSDLDIGLPDKTNDDFYLSTLEVNLKNLIQKLEPEFIFFQSGVDILETDKMGRLSVTKDGCKARDRMVLETAKKNKIPIVASMGGGYSDFLDVIDAHANTYRMAQEIFF